jgi:hypothetical protein
VPRSGFRGDGLFVEVGEDIFDDHWVFEAGDDLDGTAAAAKGFDVDGS